MDPQISPQMRQIAEEDMSPSAKCYAFLKEAILTGYFKRGQRIVERDIIQLLSVSRTPLREALRKLENEKLVEHSQNRGCTVIGFTGQDITELFEVRKVLECFMLQVVAKKAAKEELLALREETLRRKDSFSDEKEYWNFHLQLLKLSRHRRLGIMLGQLEEYIERIHVLSFARQGRREQALSEHIGIVDALLAGDADKAAGMLGEHLDKSYSALKDILAIV